VDDELIRRSFGGGPKNFASDKALEEAYRTALIFGDRKEIARLYKKIMEVLFFHHHMSAAEAQSKLPAGFWYGATKFAVDRHPYEKVVSLAKWRGRRLADELSVQAEFLDEVVSKGEYRNFDLYSDGAHLLVDKVIRYEELWEHLRDFAQSFGERLPEQLPTAKSQYRKDRRPASEILSADHKRRVYERCAEEFELLGYER